MRIITLLVVLLAAFSVRAAPVSTFVNCNDQASGIYTLQGIADALNRRGIQISRKAAWHWCTVRNVLARGAL